MNGIALICIGNRYVAEDAVGSRVYERLVQEPLASKAARGGVRVVDGGLCGLDLLREVDGRRRVVFVDAVADIGTPGEVVQLDGAEVAALAGDYGHAAGLPYLLSVMPQVCDAPPSEVTLLGRAGPLDDAGIQTLAHRSLEVALHGTR